MLLWSRGAFIVGRHSTGFPQLLDTSNDLMCSGHRQCRQQHHVRQVIQKREGHAQADGFHEIREAKDMDAPIQTWQSFPSQHRSGKCTGHENAHSGDDPEQWR